MKIHSSFDLGLRQEAKTRIYLEGRGWRILHSNWRIRAGELDLVALEPGDKMLVIVEVKARSGEGVVADLDLLSAQKLRRIRRTTEVMIARNDLCGARPEELRVDLVVWRGEQLRHYVGVV